MGKSMTDHPNAVGLPIWIMFHNYDGQEQVEVFQHRPGAVKRAAEITVEYINASQKIASPQTKVALEAMSRQDYDGVLDAISVCDLDEYCSVEVWETTLQ